MYHMDGIYALIGIYVTICLAVLLISELAPAPIPITVEMVCEAFPQLSDFQCQDLLNGSVWLGMTEAEAMVAWGRPKTVSRSVGSWGVHEQWIYYSPVSSTYSMRYLYFENGILTSWGFLGE